MSLRLSGTVLSTVVVRSHMGYLKLSRNELKFGKLKLQFLGCSIHIASVRWSHV